MLFFIFFLLLFFQVFNSRSDDMIVNISTNTPVFHVQGLSSGTEYRVQIYSIQQGGRVSKHAAFETFTLQVIVVQLSFRYVLCCFVWDISSKKVGWICVQISASEIVVVTYTQKYIFVMKQFNYILRPNSHGLLTDP